MPGNAHCSTSNDTATRNRRFDRQEVAEDFDELESNEAPPA